MSQDGYGRNREEVPLERIVLSNMYSPGGRHTQRRNSNLICGTTYGRRSGMEKRTFDRADR